jgi:hypothetical protein
VKPAICNENLKGNVTAFRQGKRDFNVQELNDIKLYLLKCKDHLENATFYEGSLLKYKVLSCFAEDFQDELLDHMLVRMNAAISIVVLLKDKKVVLKSNKDICNINLCKIATVLCDSACIESEDSVIEGKITQKFLKFTTQLKPCI